MKSTIEQRKEPIKRKKEKWTTYKLPRGESLSQQEYFKRDMMNNNNKFK
jgi:hypothetical protein